MLGQDKKGILYKVKFWERPNPQTELEEFKSSNSKLYAAFPCSIYMSDSCYFNLIIFTFYFFKRDGFMLNLG